MFHSSPEDFFHRVGLPVCRKLRRIQSYTIHSRNASSTYRLELLTSTVPVFVCFTVLHGLSLSPPVASSFYITLTLHCLNAASTYWTVRVLVISWTVLIFIFLRILNKCGLDREGSNFFIIPHHGRTVTVIV